MSLPTTMNAVVISGDVPAVKQVPLPPLEDGHVLLKTKAIAGNPTDWKHIAFKIGPQGSILGCDVAGEIVKIGENVDSKEFHLGDHVFGFVHGASVRLPTNGAFAEYVALDSKLAYHCPTNCELSGKDSLPEGPVTNYEGCVTLPVSLTTAGVALTHNLGNKLEWEPTEPQHNFPILLWGGATAIGQPLIQLAKKLHGYSKIIVVASRKHEKQLKEYGADELFDYHDADVIEQIKAKYPNIQQLVDCVSNKETIQQVYKCASDNEPATVLQLVTYTIKDIKPEDRKDNVKITGTLLYVAAGHDVPFGSFTLPKDLVYREHTREFIKFINPKLVSGEIHHIPVKVYKGLEGAVQITDDIKNNRNSGTKLVAVLN
ncbi:similar to Saccharomyces cerevisiae YNL134C Putative protein of unknown function with similarity to dehydrogenases from other model organisms [Maudiozyma saulgeensis]|uniref:Enoyl reductase (ER) domain-containing protein n=1 Tax=Maudiozyma saulgeensis TaxID=1789683 RepID=A0A1X7QY97_9SACH|nr:similar to Saccharomyces cerevisiae YNL134C Putative protein of unknown function with similarity to dehydrogenases from other model organisms [Kazachstania saulgeensis]